MSAEMKQKMFSILNIFICTPLLIKKFFNKNVHEIFLDSLYNLSSNIYNIISNINLYNLNLNIYNII